MGPTIAAKKVVINEEIGTQIRNYVGQLLSHPSLAAGFKDPYLLLCLDSWLQYLPRDIVFVGVFRSPNNVGVAKKKISIWLR